MRLVSAVQARFSVDANRWDEKSGLQRDALSSQVIDALEAQEIKEARYEEAYPYVGGSDTQQEVRTADHSVWIWATSGATIACWMRPVMFCWNRR